MIKNKNTFALSALTFAMLIGSSLAATSFAAHANQPSEAKSVASGTLAIKSLSATESNGETSVRVKFSSKPNFTPKVSRISSPDRLMFDMPGVINGTGSRLHEINAGGVKSINVIQAEGVARVILALNNPSGYRMSHDGDDLVFHLGDIGASELVDSSHVLPTQASNAVANGAKHADTLAYQNDAPAAPVRIATVSKQHSLSAIDFRRGPSGEGRVVFDMTDSAVSPTIKQQGSKLIVDFPGATIPEQLLRRMNVGDFGTPIKMVSLSKTSKGIRMVAEPTGLWEFNSYQTDGRYVVEVRPVAYDPNKLTQGSAGGYKGERMTLNFQNIDVRSLLNVIADFTKLNIVAADNVQGMMTIRLQDVPWDQALELIMQTRNLDMRKNGNVIWVAPREEIAKVERERMELSAQTIDLEPLRTEGFQLNYTRADDVVKILGDARQRILSKRGSVVLDPRTNQIFVNDSGGKLDEVRQILEKIDVPVRQVQIEARIVEANDKFSRSIGARLGFTSIGLNGILGTSESATRYLARPLTNGMPSGNAMNNVNLPASGLDSGQPAATFSTVLMNTAGTRFLNLELSALEADGRGKIVSSPSVVTADQEKALIEQGTELPYLEASASGAATVSFKKANLRLEVTPQITPDGNVIMSVDINKDAPGAQTTSGFAIDTKHVKTKVLVENGGTVVIGGIFSQDERNSVSKVPFLGDIPVVGAAFRTTTRQDTKTELLIFLTPRILETQVGGVK